MKASHHTRRAFLKTATMGAASLAGTGCLQSLNRPPGFTASSSVLHQTDFSGPADGWRWPRGSDSRFLQTSDGLVFQPRANETLGLAGDGVHTRNGDSIELHFSLGDEPDGALTLGFQGGMERADVTLDFRSGEVVLATSEWKAPQPVARAVFEMERAETHVLLVEKRTGPGQLVRNADFAVFLDGIKLLEARNQDVLPEMGVHLAVRGVRVVARRFVHRGRPSGIPEYLRVGGWQMPNRPDLAANLDSMCRGLVQAAERGVQLLVTPETSLTGLFPSDPVTLDPAPVAEAEAKLRRFMRDLKNAPYLVAGLPVWSPAENGRSIRRNASRLYDPEGGVAGTFLKIHSCEPDFWHGYRLNEFDVGGVPFCMHICHDGRYPETWTLPVMFGARVIVHPANPVSELKSRPTASAPALDCVTTCEPERETPVTGSSHAFYLHVSGADSTIASPQGDKSASVEYNRWKSGQGETHEALCHKRIRVHGAFGYWPTRSFRASEQVASAYLALYRAMGGTRA